MENSYTIQNESFILNGLNFEFFPKRKSVFEFFSKKNIFAFFSKGTESAEVYCRFPAARSGNDTAGPLEIDGMDINSCTSYELLNFGNNANIIYSHNRNNLGEIRG